MTTGQGIPIEQFGLGFKALSLATQAALNAAWEPDLDKPATKVNCKFCRGVAGSKGCSQAAGNAYVSRRMVHLATQCPEPTAQAAKGDCSLQPGR